MNLVKLIQFTVRNFVEGWQDDLMTHHRSMWCTLPDAVPTADWQRWQ